MPTSKVAEPSCLATYWRPLRDVGAPIACLASTYTFHAALFEEELLPRFLGLRFDNTERERVFVAEREDHLGMVTAAVFVDAAHIDGRQTTGRWSQVPVRVKGGCQHSKVVVLLWEKMIRVLVTSANLTSTGYRKNREVAACLDFYKGEGAAPGKLLDQILDFFEHDLMPLGRMPPGTRTRLTEAIRQSRKRAKGWMLPKSSDTLPTTTFIPVSPKHDTKAARNVMGPLLHAWGSGKAREIHVMTPFVGDSAVAVRSTMKELFRIPRTRGAEGHVITGGHPSQGDSSVFNLTLPDWFRDEWSDAWKGEKAPLSVYVIPPRRAGEKADRQLHAKGLLVTSDDRTLLVVGSSNFSPHGFGVSIFNLEANLCYVVRDPNHIATLKRSLPVDWNTDGTNKVRWPNAPDVVADDPPPTNPLPPDAFLWATFHEQTGTLSIAIDAACTLPKKWSIRIPGRDRSVFESDRDPLAITSGLVTFSLGEAGRAQRLTYFTLRWTDEKGVQREARMPTLVNDDAELLPPEGLRSLQSDDIVSCLLSGKDPVEWAEDEEHRDEAGKRKKSDKSYDLLKTIDTDSYVIYRTRRFGRALAALSQRLLATLPTPTAIQHRLQKDPVGPLMLARAVSSEGQAASTAGRAATLFALGELQLTLSYLALRVDPKGKLGLRPLFEDTRRMIDDLAQTYDYDAPKADPLKRYIAAVRRNCERASTEGLHAR
jgi:hypothetical protein